MSNIAVVAHMKTKAITEHWFGEEAERSNQSYGQCGHGDDRAEEEGDGDNDDGFMGSIKDDKYLRDSPFSLSFLLSYPKHITPSEFFPLFPLSPALSSFRTKLRVHSSATPSHGSSPCTTSSHGSATPRHATTAALLHRTAAAALLLRNDAAALLRRTTSSPCSSALLRVSFANRAASAPSIPARFALSSTTFPAVDWIGKINIKSIETGLEIYANFITILMGQNNKVKDTNNRNARVIYDAKEVINGLQAPIVKDAEMDNVDKRPGMLRSPKYTNKCVDEVFPARKSKFGVVSGKENAKENPSLEKTTTSNLKNVLVFSTSAAKRQQGSSCQFHVQYHIPGRKAPLDLTLKTGMRVISSSSLNWVHRSLTHHIKPKFSFPPCTTTGQNVRGSQGFKVLHSLMYPQSILPPSLTSVLSSLTADAVCTSQFVVMFIGGDSSGSPKYFCNAYISR
ncbi:hypothetical protein AHAS_Ahas06G0078900 [Arachis hypogaea]